MKQLRILIQEIRKLSDSKRGHSFEGQQAIAFLSNHGGHLLLGKELE